MVPNQKAIEARQKHMSIVNRCHFQLKGGAKFDTLVARLIEYVDNLLKMCSETQAEVKRFFNWIDSAVF